jgi:hypothetical protein
VIRASYRRSLAHEDEAQVQVLDLVANKMRDIPFEILLTFPRPNYENPETQGRSLIIVNSVLAGLVFTAVVLRCYTRLYLKRWFGSDDYAIVFATV